MTDSVKKIHWLLLLAIVPALFLSGCGRARLKGLDVHEHIESMAQAEILIEGMDAAGVDRTVLLPSPIETITLNGNSTFTGYQQNIDEILMIAKKFPDRFIPFCTLSPLDEDALEIFKDCVKRGGKGLKLYNGHSFYYGTFGIKLDDPVMLPIYAFAEEKSLPIMFHVNVSKFGADLRRVLSKYPDLRVAVPHFMISSVKLSRVTKLFDDYPNLYTDVSFGHTPFMAAGLRRLSKLSPKFRDFFEAYPDRILFGADLVLTAVDWKNEDYAKDTMNCYRDLLEKEKFRCKPVSDYYADQASLYASLNEGCLAKEGDFCKAKAKEAALHERRAAETKSLTGLGLPREVLQKIYHENPKRWLGLN